MGLNPALVRDYRRARANEQLFLPQPSKVAFATKQELHQYTGEYIGSRTLLTYLEFGVASGNSLRGAASRFTNPWTRFFGFDSFIGLPEDWSVGPDGAQITIAKGTFSQKGVPPEFGDARVSFVPGWFQNTVPSFLATQAPALVGRTAFVHFDADLYSSTLFLLCSLWPHISEYYFMMDDFFQDDMVALHDFTTAYPVSIEWIAHVKNVANDPCQIFGRMKRISFKLDDI